MTRSKFIGNMAAGLNREKLLDAAEEFYSEAWAAERAARAQRKVRFRLNEIERQAQRNHLRLQKVKRRRRYERDAEGHSPFKKGRNARA